MEYSEIGERIAFLRIKNNYTREAFAERVSISSKFLYEIETGKKGFSVKILYNISEALLVSCDYIVTGRNDSQALDRSVTSLFKNDQIIKVQKLLKMVHEINAGK